MGFHVLIGVSVVLALVMPVAALAQSEVVEAPGVFDALDEPRWITITTTESGNTYALVASYLDNAVQIIDVTDPNSPVPVAAIRDGEDGFEALGGGNAITVTTVGGNTYALVASYLENAVQIIDVTDPTSPVPVAAIRDGEDGFEALAGPFDIEVVAASGTTYILVASWLDGAVQVVDMSEPTSPVPVAAIRDGEDGFEDLGGAISIAMVDTQDGTYALVAGFTDDAIQIVDVTDPATPLPAGVIADGFGLSQPTHIDTATISGKMYAVVSSYAENYVQIIDVTDLAAPSEAAVMKDDEDGFDALLSASRVEVIAASGSTYLLVSGFNDNAIQIVDVTDPYAPSPAGIIADGNDGFDGLRGASSMATVTTPDRTYVLVTAYTDDAVQIIDMTDPLAPLAVTSIHDAQDSPAKNVGMVDVPLDMTAVIDRFDIDGIEARVTATVTDAALMYAASGEEGAFGIMDAPRKHAPESFVLDMDSGMVVFHSVDAGLEDVFQNTLSEADRPLGVILDDIAVNGGTWVNHMFPHPDTSIIQEKRSWLYEHGGYIFGAGYYLHDAEAQVAVDGMVDRYKSDGTAAFDEIVATDSPSLFVHLDSPPDVLFQTAAKPYEQIIGELEVYGYTWVSYITQNPGAGIPQTVRMWLAMHDGHIFGSGYYLPDSRILSLVGGAHLLYQSHGEAAFDMITPERSADTDALYPLVLDFDAGKTVAHGAYPHLLGAIPVGSIQRADIPWPLIQERLLTDGSVWISYVFTNPDTRTDQLKRTYLQLHDGYIFASGYYLPDARVQAVVDLAVAGYRSAGDASFEEINNSAESRADDSLYVVVQTQTGTTLASGAPSDYVADLDGLVVNSNRDLLVIYDDLVEDGSAWFEWTAINPSTGTEQVKRAWLYLYDDLLFQSGYYLPDSEIQSVVDRTVFLYRNEGVAAFDAITPEASADTDEPYPFVLAFDTSDTVAHGAFPHLLGEVPSASLHQGDKTWPQIQEELLTSGGTWASYVFINPDTGTDQKKRAWLYLHDGYVFAAGYYIRDSQVQAIVNNAILMYQSDPENALSTINALSEREPTSTYPFAVNASTYTIVAHGSNPLRIGTLALSLTEADRPAEEILADLRDNRGTWSHYTLINPLTGEEESKRSWLSLHDGYIFGSGYYDIGIDTGETTE